MLKYVFAFLIIAIAWAVVLLLALPWWIAVAVTAFVLFVLLGLFLYRRYKALKAAREIEKALNAQAEEQARSARPEQQAEVRALQAEFNRAVGALKSSKLGRSGAEALYALPWYVIIGPPGAGKTTALRNSGLQFPYLNAQSGGGVKGVGGTRNCEWFLSNEGVLLDTAGRYATEDDDRDEWFAFLDLLKKTRARKPINGLILAVNVTEIGTAREAQIEGVVRKLRERIDEVQNRLQVALPVYVLFTKCDLIQGFSEFFTDLRKNDRGQIWGFTVPLAQQPESASNFFAERFDQMARTVEQRSLKRISTELNLGARENIYQFPQQFQSLKQNLAEFIGALFASNSYQSSPLLRGVYFTSGTQEGRPIDQLAERMRASFGLAQSAARAPEPVTEQKSFFLRDVFSRVIFPDQSIATISADEKKRLSRQKYKLAAAGLGLAALVSILPAIAYLESKDLVDRSSNSAELIRDHIAQRRNIPLTTQEIEPLGEVVAELKRYHDGHAPFLQTSLGMYKGEELYPQMSRLYAQAMKRYVVEPLAANDVIRMRRFVNQHPTGTNPNPDNRRTYHDQLKLYLLLSPTNPATPGEPRINRPLTDFMTDNLTRDWVESIPPRDRERLSAHDRTVMNNNSRLFVGLLADDPGLRINREVRTVTDVRQVLTRVSTADIALDAIIREVDERFPDYAIELQKAIGDVEPTYLRQVGRESDRRVRGAFTRRGWEDYVRDRLKQTTDELLGEEWVLGRARNLDDERRKAETLLAVRSDYFRRYISEWRNFMSSMQVRSPDSETQALDMLEWFTRGTPPPYGALFRTLAENVELLDPDEAAAQAGTSSLFRQLQREARARVNRTRTGMILGAAATDALAARGAGTGPATNIFFHDNVATDPILQGLTRFGTRKETPPAPQAPPGGTAPPPGPPQIVEGPGLRAYQEQLQFVRNELRTHVDNPTQPTGQLMSTLQTARTTVSAQVNAAAIEARPVLQQLLPPPFEFAVQQARAAMAGGSSDRWCTAVVTPFHETLRGRYPFDPNGHDAAFADVVGFYRPQTGALWAFYTAELADNVPRRGDVYEFSTRLGQSTSPYLPVLLEHLNRAQDVTTVLFVNPTDAKVEFDIRVRPTPTIAEVSFSVDGDEMLYRNGPEEWHHYTWPGAGQARGAKIRARGLNGVDETIEQEGEWGLFRLFEAGQVRYSPGRTFAVVWHLRDQNIDIGVDVRPARSQNPFFGVPGHSETNTPPFMLPFRGPNVEPPHPIARSARRCNLSGVQGAPTPADNAERPRRHRRRHSSDN